MMTSSVPRRLVISLFVAMVALAGAAAPALAQTRLSFPRVVNNSNERTGIAIANLSTTVANLTFRAYNEQGQLITGAGITNPATFALGASKQLAVIVTQLFGNAFITNSSWVEVTSDQAQIAGFFLFFDDALNFLDGVDAHNASQSADSMTFTETSSALINLANAGAVAADAVTMGLFSDAGALVSSVNIPSIPSKGFFSATLSSLFPSVAQDPTVVRSVRVTSTNANLQGFALLGDRTRFISGMNGLSASSGGGDRLYVPQYVEDANFRSQLSVVNRSNSTINVSLQLVGTDGIQLGTTAQRAIPSNGKTVINDPAAFGRPRSGPRTEGYVIVSGPGGANLAGSVTFGDPAGTAFQTTLPAIAQLQQDVVYSQAVMNDLFYTGAAIINLSSNNSTSTVWLYDTNGNLVNDPVTRPLNAHARDTFVLSQLFPGVNLSAGYFRIRNNQGNMATFAVFGTNSATALSAVPPQTVTPAPPPPFNPKLTLDITPLTKGGVPAITGSLSTVKNEAAIRSFESRLDAGRLDFANLPVGKVLSESQVEIDKGVFATVVVAVVSNDGTTVRTTVRVPSFGFTLADGLGENVGADGVRVVITIRPETIPDGEIDDGDPIPPFLLGNIWILPSTAGKTITATTTLTSVLFNGVARSVVRTQSFITTP